MNVVACDGEAADCPVCRPGSERIEFLVWCQVPGQYAQLVKSPGAMVTWQGLLLVGEPMSLRWSSRYRAAVSDAHHYCIDNQNPICWSFIQVYFLTNISM